MNQACIPGNKKFGHDVLSFKCVLEFHVHWFYCQNLHLLWSILLTVSTVVWAFLSRICIKLISWIVSSLRSLAIFSPKTWIFWNSAYYSVIGTSGWGFYCLNFSKLFSFCDAILTSVSGIMLLLCVCMCVSMCACVCTCVFVHIFACVRVWTRVFTLVWRCVCVCWREASPRTVYSWRFSLHSHSTMTK